MSRARGATTQRRERAQRRGRFAEWLCLWHLRLRGWRILARGWRCPSGEIDILARRGRVLAIVEVKSRNQIDAQHRRCCRGRGVGSPAPRKPSCCRAPISLGSSRDST
jgi:predicted AAA+ superfamily ATPase